MKRRRCLGILAGTTAAALTACRSKADARATRWNGVLFNAEVDLALHGLARNEAEVLIERCVAEMQRLERMFSLYLPDSVLCLLNRAGRVEEAPPEFVALVQESLSMAEQTDGAFDPTVQPYWWWLRKTVEAGRRIDTEEQSRELAKVDYRKVTVEALRGEVRYEGAGMAMTLNGIAQGWITDRVCELLREGGAEHCLVNLGEFYALGSQPSGKNWRVGIRGAEKVELHLRERALAVSSGSGFYFGTGKGNNHLIDPRTGMCAEDHRRIVAVTAGEACTADALSTACAILDDGEAEALVAKWEGAEVRILRPAS